MSSSQKIQLFILVIAVLVLVTIPFAAEHEGLEWWVPIFFGLFFYVVTLWTTRCPSCGGFFTMKSASNAGSRVVSMFKSNLRQECESCGHTRIRPNRGGGA